MLTVPAVYGSDHPLAPGTGPNGGGNCNWRSMVSKCVMVYVESRQAPYLVSTAAHAVPGHPSCSAARV